MGCTVSDLLLRHNTVDFCNREVLVSKLCTLVKAIYLSSGYRLDDS